MPSQFEKSTIGSNLFGGKKPAGVITQDSARSNAHPDNRSAGGYVPGAVLHHRAGDLSKLPLKNK
jgi:hypothetical protein